MIEQLQNYEEDSKQTKLMVSWNNPLCSGDDLTKAILLPKNNDDPNKTKEAVKLPSTGSCICSPTSHTGSFRCRFHRFNGTQKSHVTTTATDASDANVSKSSVILDGYKTRRSRFGGSSSKRATSLSC